MEESHLIEKVSSFPKLPGVYLMKNQSGDVIYIGKAKDLRARVKTYFMGGDGRLQIEFLLKKLHDIEVIVTNSENQAFILERDLITRYKPRYNIRLKDDRAYLNIRIDMNAAWPRLELVRRVQEDDALYFGPYASSLELRNLLEVVRRAVPLRTCTDTVFYNRQRPCLEYQIKRCAGPCCLEVDELEYRGWVKQAIAILEGRGDALIRDLEQAMQRASDEMRFEDAADYRDRIKALRGAKENQEIQSDYDDNFDIFALYREDSFATLSVLRIRYGKIADTVNFRFTEVAVSDEEIIEAAIGQYYESGHEIPAEIIIPFEFGNQSLVQSALRERHEKLVDLTWPQRGAKARLLNLALLNARQYFSTIFEAESQQLDVSKELARILKLKQIPRRIECVDISNLQGSDIVGAIVVFFDGQPEKQSYKKYTISFQDKPDDFAAMHEVVSRRLERAQADSDAPDLLIIDGGIGQLRKALEARDKLRLNLEVVALAKKRMIPRRKSVGSARDTMEKKPERVFVEGAEVPILLDPAHRVTHFLERVRDEVHRYVISFHRGKRERRVASSKLDQIPGIGPERKRRLLKRFGSVKGVGRATPEEISKVGRMPITLAERVIKRLR